MTGHKEKGSKTESKQSESKDSSALVRDIGFEFYRKGDLETALSAMAVAYKLKPSSPFLRMRVDKIRSELGVESPAVAKADAYSEGASYGNTASSSQSSIQLLSQDQYSVMYEAFRKAAESDWNAQKKQFLSRKVELETITKKINDAYKQKRGLSVIRSGDGEGSFLSRRLTTCEKELFYLCARGSLRLHFGHQDYKYNDLDFWANEIFSAFVSSDIITSARDEGSVDRLVTKDHGLDFRSMVGQIAGSIVPYTIALKSGNLVYESGYLHRDLIPYYHDLLRDKKVILIGPNDESFAERFGGYFGCSVTNVISIPGQYVVEKLNLGKPLYPYFYQEILSRLFDLDLSGKICLVGAGLAGKVFCSKIAQNGGIGLDVGSMMDAWSGKKARKYHTSDFLDASSVIKC